MIKKSSRYSSENVIKIHYKRDDQKYENWALWLWEFPSGEGEEYEFNEKDEFGVVASYPLSLWSNLVMSNNLGFIIKSKGSWNKKDIAFERSIQFSKLHKDQHDCYHIYLKNDDPVIYSNKNLKVVELIKIAKFVNLSNIEIETVDQFSEYKIYENDKEIIQKTLQNPVKSLKIKLEDNFKFSFKNNYFVEIKFKNESIVSRQFISIRELYKTEHFKKEYYYDGELGAIYTPKATTFRVWSPFSNAIKVRLYKNGTPSYIDKKKGSNRILDEYEMTKNENGVFEVTVNKNLEGKYYTYVVNNAVYKNKEIIDPYARSAGLDGIRGMIVDFEKTNPSRFQEIKPFAYDPKHLTVYETHIADITSSKTWSDNPKNEQFRCKFLGACLKGTTFTQNGIKVRTGFDHIKELGVNAVQLLPIFDQANDEVKQNYNWGYNPLNYNVIEGSYSSNPSDGYARIREFKQLVKAYHDSGINIIMDVVFNHVNSAPGSNFEVLMPGYYFRYNSDGTLSNGSGCGNETASEMPMYRKFMIDSVLFFAKEYKIAGFRFDLMGLHDLETMEILTQKLKDFDPNIVVYGEPWCGGASKLDYKKAAVQSNVAFFRKYGAFNDKMRDSLSKVGGWATNSYSQTNGEDILRIVSGIKGSLDQNLVGSSDPNKTLNYVSCHDNYTLFDRFMSANIMNEDKAKKVAMLCNSIVFTSSGISLMLAGEEFLRSKNGCENSYNASYEINEINYALKVKHFDMFENFQKLIKFKQEISDLALEKDENLKLDVKMIDSHILMYELKDNKHHRIYKVVHANGFKENELGSVDLMDYTLYLDTLEPNKKLSTYTKINAFETIIAYKEQ